MTSSSPQDRSTEVVLRRRLRPAEQDRRSRILAAGRELAVERGYAATTIRAVAAQAGTTPVTVYRYFASKDELLHQVMMEWAADTAGRLDDRRYDGAPADRVGLAFCDVLQWAAEERDLLAAGITAFTAPDVAHTSTLDWHDLFILYVRTALDDPGWEDSDGQADVIGHVFIAALLDLTSGRGDIDATCALMKRAAAFLFR